MSDRTYLNSDYIKTPERQALDDWETTKDQAVEIAALRAERDALQSKIDEFIYLENKAPEEATK